MTTSTRPLLTAMLPNGRPGNRTAQRSSAATEPSRREYRERDFGVGYGRSSGYASDRRYASPWNGPILFRCG
ncbi:MAG: hypothetical protein ACMG5Z_01645 [Luteimonas sp.]